MPEPQTSRSRARTVLFSLGAFLVAVVLAWTLGEVLVRAFSAMDRINVHPRRLYTASQDPRRHYQLRPNQRDLVVHGKNVRIDLLGMRGELDDSEGSRDARRILMLGDSVVFGWGLDEAETFSVRLEQELRGRGWRARVSNGGTPGYNTLSELAALEALASRLDPDLVVLGVSLNDFTVTPRLSPQGYLTTREADDELSWLDRNSELYVLWRWFLGSGRIPGLFSEQARGRKAQQLETYFEKRAIALREKFYREPEGEGFERIQDALGAIRNFTRERGIDLVVVVFPEKDQVEAQGDQIEEQRDAPAPQRRWAQWCGELELRCLDLHSAFLESFGRGELFNDLQHPNAAGIAAAARATADLLESSRPRRPNDPL